MRTILPLLAVGVFAGAILIGAADNLPAFKAERWVNDISCVQIDRRSF